MVGTQVTLEQMAWLLSPQNETVNPSSKKAHQCHLVSIRVLGKVNELLVYDCWKPSDDWAFACWPTQGSRTTSVPPGTNVGTTRHDTNVGTTRAPTTSLSWQQGGKKFDPNILQPLLFSTLGWPCPVKPESTSALALVKSNGVDVWIV